MFKSFKENQGFQRRVQWISGKAKIEELVRPRPIDNFIFLEQPDKGYLPTTAQIYGGGTLRTNWVVLGRAIWAKLAGGSGLVEGCNKILLVIKLPRNEALLFYLATLDLERDREGEGELEMSEECLFPLQFAS